MRVVSIAENKALLQHIFSELAVGNSRALVEAMADDFCWTVTGTMRWSRRYEGKQSVLTDLFGALRSRIVDRVKTIPKRFIAEDDFVVVEAVGDNMTISGVPYNNRYCFVFRVENGKLREVTEYFDTALAADALGQGN
jgi:ketosteroid isomerase-like protein